MNPAGMPLFIDEPFAAALMLNSDPRLASRIEQVLLVRPVAEITRCRNCLGVSRFLVAPEFAPETILTCVWWASRVDIDFVQGRFSVIDLHPPFDRRPPRRCKGSLSLSLLPSSLRGWARIKEAIHEAPSCQTISFGGAFYWHRLWDDREEMFRTWFNPDEHRHPGASQIVAAYRLLLIGGVFRSLLPRWL